MNNARTRTTTHRTVAAYAVVAAVTLFVDRITKLWAVEWLPVPQKINDYLSFELAFNRGVSWSFLSSESPLVFTLVSVLVATITAGLMVYAVSRARSGYAIYAEVLVVCGSLSNLVDRALYQGVVDFIALSYTVTAPTPFSAGTVYAWPIFNIADICIVGGVIWMVISSWRE